MKQVEIGNRLFILYRCLHLVGQISFLILGCFLPFLVLLVYAKPAESKSLEPTGNEFEYTLLDSNDPGGPVYDWIDISSTGTVLTGWTSTDDGYAGPVPLGFTIDYYGNAYNEIFVGSNGYANFGQGNGSIPGGILPNPSQPNNDIALFGGDMYLNNYGSDSQVHYETLDNPTRFVLQFTNLYYCCGQNTPHDFEMILFPNGDILAQYQSLNGTSTSYVGIENQDGTVGLSYGDTLSDTLAIQYYYPSGLFLNPLNSSGYGLAGSTVSYTLQLANQRGITDTFDLTVLPGNNWATTLSLTQTGELGDGENIDFDVWVDIPPAADPGDVDLATILATSVISPTTISDTAEIQTTAASEDVAYVAVANYDYLALVDAAAHIVVDTIDLNPAGCDFPWRVNIPPDGQTVWVSCRWSNNVIVLDHNSNTVLATINIVGPHGISFTNDSAFALVGSNSSNFITIVDTTTYFTSNLNTSGRPTDISVHPFLPIAYATNKNGTILDIIDLNTFSITNQINIGQTSEFVTISMDGLRVYTSNRGDNTISAIDTLTNVEIARIPVGFHPLDLSLNADGSRLFVALANGDVAVIDTTTLSQLSPLTIDPAGNFDHPWGTDTICLANLMFVSNSMDGFNPDGRQVAVVDLSGTPTVTALIPMPDTDTNGSPDHGARGIAVCPQFVGQGILLSTPRQKGNAALGEKTTYETTLYNFTGVTDSFTLTLGSHNWPTTVTPDLVGPVANTAGVTFTVEVTVPISATWYQTDTVEVTATSVTSPSTYVDNTLIETKAYAPPDISLDPNLFTSTQFVDEVTTQTLMIGNGNGVDLSFLIEPSGQSGVSFFAASTELYGYNIFPNASPKIIGLEDNTAVRLIDLTDGSIQVEDPDLDRYELLNAYPGPLSFFKIESDKPVVGFANNQSGSYSAFIPSIDGDAVGDEFIFYYHRPENFYVFAIEDADVEVFDDNGILVATQSILAGKYWDLNLTNNRVYHVLSNGRITMEAVGENGYTTVPDVTGKGLGRLFYFGTHYWQSGAIAVFAYQDADIEVYDLDTDQLLWSSHINAGDHWWQTDVGTRKLRLESTGDVEVWAGSTEGGTNIEDLGDDISFAAGDRGREFYLHSLQDGTVIFAPFANTQVNVDGTIYNLDKDEYLYLSGCCAFHHILSNQPILIQTLGGDTSWNDIGTYLGGVSIYGGLPVNWLSTDPFSGTVGTESDLLVEVVFDSYGIQPGDYTADLIVASNDSVSPTLYVPVTMTVEPTANMGWVEGTVTDASSGEPLAAAIAALGQPYVVYSDPDTGYYKLWLDAGSYSLEGSTNDYVTGTVPVNISAQQGTLQDFALVPFRPVMQVDPETIDVVLPAGQTTNRVMTITNAGPDILNYDLNEFNLGYTPQESLKYEDVVLLMHFEESAGATTFADSSDNNYDGFCSGNSCPSAGVSGRIGNGVQFDGIDDYIQIPPFTMGGPISIGAWVYAENLDQYWSRIIDFGNGSYSDNILLTFYESTGRMVFEVFDGGSSIRLITNETFPENQWVHVTAVNDGLGNGQIYWDGVLVKSGPMLGPNFVQRNNQYIARSNWGIDDYYDGIIDEIVVFNRALTPEDVSDLYNYGFGLDVPWLTMNPISGTIPAYGAQPVQIAFDTTDLQPGTHSARILANSNDPLNPTDIVTVTLDVQPTPSMGQVRGTITDAWTGDQLTATVELLGVYTMLADPDFNIWAEAGMYSLSAYAPPEYFTVTVPVEITAGGITIQNLALEPAQPRLEWDPGDIEVTVSTGDTTQATLTLDNTGPIPLIFSIHEVIPENMLLNPNDLDGKRILFDRAHGQPPMSDYDTLIADLVAAGAVVNENTTFPITAPILANYDVLWSTCCGSMNWTFNELSTIEDWLNEGGAVLVQGGVDSSTEDLADIYGITYIYGGCYDGVTTDISNHPISNGVTSVYVDYTCSQLAAGAGTDIVVYDSQSQPHVAAHEAGNGKMVVVSSEDFADFAINNEDNRLLALNTMTWLANPPYTDLDWMSATPDSGVIPGHGQQDITIMVNATSLIPGEYEAILAIEHNDPDQSFPVEIPVSVEVVTNGIYLPVIMNGSSSEAITEARIPFILIMGLVMPPVGYMGLRSFNRNQKEK